jgi:hypothetical protein
MPQQNFSGRIGKSSSPIVNRVIQNSKDAQQPCGSKPTAEAYNKMPVKK